VRRRAGTERPAIPPWVVEFREWDGAPGAPFLERRWQWSRELWEWLERYDYDAFDLNDAELEWRAKS
jgi:hypothetical protein